MTKKLSFHFAALHRKADLRAASDLAKSNLKHQMPTSTHMAAKSQKVSYKFALNPFGSANGRIAGMSGRAPLKTTIENVLSRKNKAEIEALVLALEIKALKAAERLEVVQRRLKRCERERLAYGHGSASVNSAAKSYTNAYISNQQFEHAYQEVKSALARLA